MDPHFEQRLRDEVIYLHSLWHEGPPRPATRNPPSTRPLHQLASPPQFKRERINPRRKRGKKRKNQYEEEGKTPTQYNEVSGKEWPCSSTTVGSPAPTVGWPAVTVKPNSQPLSLSPGQQARLAAKRAQSKALNATKEFFRSDNSDDDEGDNEIEGDDDLMEEDNEVEEYRFFLKLFMEDSELKEYYEKNYENGEFSCLVCGGVGKKNAGKRFKDCVALVQHSISIAKTKKRHAHRAYGQAICKVLAWEVDRLPTIVVSSSQKFGASLNNAGVREAEAPANVGDETKDGPNDLGNAETPVDTSNGQELPEKNFVSDENLPNNVESVVFENSLDAAEASKGAKDSSLTIPVEFISNESIENANLPSNDEAVVLENSLAAAEASKCAEDFSLTIPEMVADKDTEKTHQVNSLTITEVSKCAEDFRLIIPEMEEDKKSGQANHVEPAKDAVVGDEGKGCIPDDQVKSDGAS